MTGSRYERELVNAFAESGWSAMRCPTSGSATDRDLPDVLALRWAAHARSDAGLPTAEVWAIEAKTTAATTAYASGEEVNALEAFASNAGAIPLIAARFKRRSQTPAWFLVSPDRTRKTAAGNHGVPYSDAKDRAYAVVWPDSTNHKAGVERVAEPAKKATDVAMDP